ncbi:MAG: peroxiredoxin [Methylobacteriaceae bacterium]|nr:peroxiredoxin [Methylobacteriaceae bacterium]
MAIKVGDRLPQATFRVMTANGPAPKTTDEIFAGKKVVLFAVPGAFTPTCHRNHLPGFLEKADAIKAKGIDAIAVTGVNDVFVMDAWSRATGGEGKIEFLSDGNGDFAKALGLTLDASANGLGTRSKRYSMIVDNGVLKSLNVEDAPSKADVSGAEALLKQLWAFAGPAPFPAAREAGGDVESAPIAAFPFRFFRKGFIPWRASASARSFLVSPACPRTQYQRMS